MASDSQSNLINVGRLGGPFGVKGWIKVSSSTEPKENIVNYSPWWLKTRHGVKAFEVDDHQVRHDGLVVHLKGIDDRDQATQYRLVDVAIERAQFPSLDDGDYYWHQLVGLKVINEFAGVSSVFGKVKELMETGANDVLVVGATEDSIDDRERLVPYLPGDSVMAVDLAAGEIHVQWDPEF